METENNSLNNEYLKNFPPYEIENLTKEEILGDTVINYLLSLQDDTDRILAIESVKEKAKEYKILTAFNELFKKKDKKMKSSSIFNEKNIIFPDIPNMEKIEYKTNKYELDSSGRIYEIIPDVGRILVCYHPILPIGLFKNLEDGNSKVKLAYYIDDEWNYIVVDKSIISSSQAIVKLSDVGIQVNSENAKFLVKYLTEIENLNRNIIPKSISVSRLGWFNGELIPYSKKYEVDNVKEIPNMEEMFSEIGKLENWIEFFKEKRKYNPASRIIMASSVISILLEKIKQPGFTLHIWGASENRKICCLYGSTIYIW